MRLSVMTISSGQAAHLDGAANEQPFGGNSTFNPSRKISVGISAVAALSAASIARSANLPPTRV